MRQSVPEENFPSKLAVMLPPWRQHATDSGVGPRRARPDRRRRAGAATARAHRLEAGGCGLAYRGERDSGQARSCRPRRSEEHTSELQSQSNLVCRLLLEKKKKRITMSSEEATSNN